MQTEGTNPGFLNKYGHRRTRKFSHSEKVVAAASGGLSPGEEIGFRFHLYLYYDLSKNWPISDLFS
jgi:hypothetical protein